MIYTNRDQVQTFQLDIDIQYNEYDCEDCIVIADLETVDEVNTDDYYKTKWIGTSQYFVGDFFYAEIRLVDSSYTKYLRFVSLDHKNDLGQIFVFFFIYYSCLERKQFDYCSSLIRNPNILQSPNFKLQFILQVVVDSCKKVKLQMTSISLLILTLNQINKQLVTIRLNNNQPLLNYYQVQSIQ